MTISSIPIGYLISVLFVAWCTYFIVAPSNFPRSFNSLGSYFAVINELPFFALFWLIGSNSLAFIEGDVHTPVGWMAFAISILTVGTLLVIIHRGLQTSPVVSQAMNDSLEKTWRTTINPKNERRLQKKFSFTALLGPFFKRRYDVVRIANINYGNAGMRNQLDVYRHRSHSTGCPTLVHLHGGGFVGGKKNSQSLPLIYQLASKGWVCISANYRLSPDVKFPDHF